jgi:hypothetical protein
MSAEALLHCTGRDTKAHVRYAARDAAAAAGELATACQGKYLFCILHVETDLLVMKRTSVHVCVYTPLNADPHLLAQAAGPHTGRVTTAQTGSTCNGRCLRCCKATSGACRWLALTFAAFPSSPVRSCVRGGSALARFTRSAAHTRRMGGLGMRCTGKGWQQGMRALAALLLLINKKLLTSCREFTQAYLHCIVPPPWLTGPYIASPTAAVHRPQHATWVLMPQMGVSNQFR